MRTLVVMLALVLTLGTHAVAQQQTAPPAPPVTPRTSAPTDITGVWVSVVTEDWRWRMVTPSPGDTLGIPVNPGTQKIAEAWDYAKDVAAGNACKAYGAGGIMRMPTRLRIGWQDDSTLKIETDAGQQTKLVYVDRSRQSSGPRTLQGHSTAEWVNVFTGGRGGRGAAPAAAGRGGRGAPAYGTGTLRVVTTNLLDGYLRKNGVPYSQNAIVTEHFDRVPGPDDSQWLVVKTIVEDPANLTGPYITSAHFMREPDDSKFRPVGCEIEPPLVPEKRDVR